MNKIWIQNKNVARIIRKCIICEKESYIRENELTHRAAKYCSRKCMGLGLKKDRTKPKAQIVCFICNKNFEIHFYRVKDKNYCSKKCSDKGMTNSNEDFLESAKQRLLSNHTVVNDCWIWNGAKNKKGYGLINYRGSKLTHRVSLLVFKGLEIPKGKMAMHTVCDNPPCINPSHITIGTAADNTREMMEKGRNSKNINAKHGEDHHESIINDKIAKEIKILLKTTNLTGPQIAEKYKINKYIVYDIKRNKTWRHITID